MNSEETDLAETRIMLGALLGGGPGSVMVKVLRLEFIKNN